MDQASARPPCYPTSSPRHLPACPAAPQHLSARPAAPQHLPARPAAPHLFDDLCLCRVESGLQCLGQAAHGLIAQAVKDRHLGGRGSGMMQAGASWSVCAWCVPVHYVCLCWVLGAWHTQALFMGAPPPHTHTHIHPPTHPPTAHSKSMPPPTSKHSPPTSHPYTPPHTACLPYPKRNHVYAPEHYTLPAPPPPLPHLAQRLQAHPAPLYTWQTPPSHTQPPPHTHRPPHTHIQPAPALTPYRTQCLKAPDMPQLCQVAQHT